MDELKFKVQMPVKISPDDPQFAGYARTQSLESPKVDTSVFEVFEFTINPVEGKVIFDFIEAKCMEILENFDMPEYVVLNRYLFLNLMAHIDKEYTKLPHMSKAPEIMTTAGPVTLIPVAGMDHIEIVGDIDRKVYRLD